MWKIHDSGNMHTHTVIRHMHLHLPAQVHTSHYPYTPYTEIHKHTHTHNTHRNTHTHATGCHKLNMTFYNLYSSLHIFLSKRD